MGWSFEKRCFEHGSDRIRFESCIDNLGNPQCLRVLQGHSGGAKLGAQLQSHVEIPFEWANFCIMLLQVFYRGRTSYRRRNQLSKREDKLASYRL